MYASIINPELKESLTSYLLSQSLNSDTRILELFTQIEIALKNSLFIQSIE